MQQGGGGGFLEIIYCASCYPEIDLSVPEITPWKMAFLSVDNHVYLVRKKWHHGTWSACYYVFAETHYAYV